MTKQVKQSSQELKQSILNRLEEAKKSVEALSEEELESIAGGSARFPNLGYNGLPKGGVSTTMEISESEHFKATHQLGRSSGRTGGPFLTSMSLDETSKL